jgi:hypothetical protein
MLPVASSVEKIIFKNTILSIKAAQSSVTSRGAHISNFKRRDVQTVNLYSSAEKIIIKTIIILVKKHANLLYNFFSLLSTHCISLSFTTHQY